MMFVGLSKTFGYEKPYNVTGIIKRTGLKVAPKGVCTDRNIGTWKATNMERLTIYEVLVWKGFLSITYLNRCESSGTVPLKQ